MEQLKLNMIPNGVNPVFHASQYDKGRQIRFVLDETLSGAEVTVSYRAKDGTEHGNVQTSVSGNTITDTIPEEVLTDYGIIEGEVNIDGIGSLNFFVEVEKDAYDGGVITTQTASGAIATFETNIETAFVSLKSDINPVQDLHGYSKPWSGGGGKNKAHVTATSQTISGVAYTVATDGRVKANGTASGASILDLGTITLIGGTEYTLTGCPSGGSGSTYALFLRGSGSFAQKIDFGGGNQFTVTDTVTTTLSMIVYNGYTASNLNFEPMVRLSNTSADFEPYSNICPISGFSALNVTRTGKNFAKSDNTDNPQKSYYTYSTETPDKVVGVKNHASNMFFYVFEAYVVSGNTYRFHYGKYQINGANSNCSIYLYSDNILGTSLGNFLVPDTGYTWTSNYTGRILIGIYGIGGNGSTFEIDEFMLSNTASDYSPYNGQTVTVNFGQTVYGGVADVTNGKLKITHIKITDFEQYYRDFFSGTYSTEYRITLPYPSTNVVYSVKRGSLCNCKEEETAYYGANQSSQSGSARDIFAINPLGEILAIYDADTTLTKEQFEAKYSGNIEFVYELATPIEITTTPENLTALSGQNNVYHDCNGDTEVEYYIEV